MKPGHNLYSIFGTAIKSALEPSLAFYQNFSNLLPNAFKYSLFPVSMDIFASSCQIWISYAFLLESYNWSSTRKE